MVPKLNVQSVCIYFNAFSQILQCLFGRSATRVVSKTHRQDQMVLRHVSACMLRFVKQMISCFWYAIFSPSVILLSYYEGRKRASSFRHRCSVSSALKTLSKFLMVAALGAVGLNTDFKALCKSGAKPMLHGFIISLLVVLVAIGVEYMLGIAPTGNLF